jgi:hypothetical protein
MVEPASDMSRLGGRGDRNRFPRLGPDRVRARPPWKSIVLVVTLCAGVAWALNFSGDVSSARGSSPQGGTAVAHKIETAGARPAETTTTSLVAPPVATATTTTVATVKALPVATVAPAVAPAVTPPVSAPVSEPSLAEMVAEVEAAGVEPGSNWSWSVGDTAAHCGAVSGAGTGCTYGSGGLEYSVFSGSPTLALVAHELANAETQNDAVPALLNEVAVAAAGSSWSPTDAVASCLVANFMGFQDASAGSWQCPAALATAVAAHIHDSL